MCERDLAAEIESARCDSVKLRKLANEIHTSGGSRLLIIRAIQLAQAADNGPHPLGKISAELGLPRPRGVPLYRYKLVSGAFDRIQRRLVEGLASDLLRASLAPAFVLWASDWFRRSYRGGKLKWEDIGSALNVDLSWSDWTSLADLGFNKWGVEPLIRTSDNSKQRLANLARQGGFPVHATASGASWPRKFLERAVGELLGADVQDIGTAIAICERNEYLLPTMWQNQEMYAICGELALKIVELREFVDKEVSPDGLPYSARLDLIYEEWRDELPMAMDGAAEGLIDTLLEAKKLSSSGSIRVGRMLSQHGEDWRECLDFHLDGRWDDKDQVLSPGDHIRVFLQPSDGLADRISGRLAYLEHENASRWVARPMRSEAAIEFPFDLPVTAEFHARGDRLARSFMLPGGKPVSGGLRVFEPRGTDAQRTTFALIGQGSGAYKAEPVFIDVPQDWSVRGKDDNAEIEPEDFAFAPGRCLYRCAGTIIAQQSNGDSFLVRTGQSADRKDRLSIVANAVSGVQSPDGEQLFKHPLHAQVSDGLSLRVASRGEIRWRLAGQRSWSEDLAAAGPGLCEFAWIDGSTGHVRDRLTAIILPAEFELKQRNTGTFAHIELSGWDGNAVLGGEAPNEKKIWRISIDPPRRALLTLSLSSAQTRPIELKVPLQSREWLTTWDGDLLPRETVIGIADLSDIVARVPSASILMGDVRLSDGKLLVANWPIYGELGLSALRTDIAALMRPLGIDAQVRLDFNNGCNDNWYVTEYGNSLEREPSGGWRPKAAIVGDDVRVCGRSLGTPEKELEFGSYDGLQSGLGGRLIYLPRLKGDWLIYLREGSRVLTRPKFISGDTDSEVPQHRLGRAMAKPRDLIDECLETFVQEIALDPTTEEARQSIRDIMNLALSLNGLSPMTFKVFEKLPIAGVSASLLLYRCEEQHLSAILELFDGLCSSWSLLPYGAWDAAFQAQGHYLVSRLDDPQWALTRLTERQNEIAARAPQLAPLIWRDYSQPTWEDVRSHFTDHTSEGISTDAGSFNPFRPAFRELLPKEHFLESLMRVFDAPFVAALAAMGRITLDKVQILTVKDVERRHPTYFAKAYGYALTELKNDR